ncbi:MAG TPA: TatD family hydrolase [Terriglobia bacterium]|nr:TatD family hydrolase [Terriglobia bacterium]
MAQFLVDSHCHLDDPAFSADRDAVIERARSAGLAYLLTIGGAAGPDHLHESLEIADRHEWMYAAAGVHPHEAAKATDQHFDELRQLARHPKFLAIGEIGLDYYYDHSPREVQKDVLVRQLKLARELDKPVIIHCRDAWADLREIIRNERGSAASADCAGILHCFTGSREDALELMGRGFLVSFAGNVTFKKAEELRAVAREIPLDRLLTETDSPYLAPVPYRGKRNEPAYVREVTRQLAALHGLDEAAMGEQAVRNFARFFRLARDE